MSRFIMKTLKFTFFCLLLFGVGNSINGQLIQEVLVNSEELSNHVLDHVKTYSIGVYLPPSYQDSEKRFPVLYFLPGYECNYFDKEKFVRDYQNNINNGTFKEMIVVFIDGCTSNSAGCFYLNSEATGNWEDFIVSNVVSYIDVNYRTINASTSRAIAGHSMGGYGAIYFAMLHPEVFGSVYSHSPGLFSKTGLADCQMFRNKLNIESFLAIERELAAMPKEEAHNEFLRRLRNFNEDLRFTIDYGMAVAPNLKKNAPYTDFPYTKVDGKLVKNDTLWERWENGFGNINNKVILYKDNLLALDSIVIDYGSHDYYAWIPEGCRYLSSVLSSNGIAHKLVQYPGEHSNLDRYSTIMFSMLMEILTFDNQ
jgi:S-formylglutathione hydrolase